MPSAPGLSPVQAAAGCFFISPRRFAVKRKYFLPPQQHAEQAGRRRQKPGDDRVARTPRLFFIIESGGYSLLLFFGVRAARLFLSGKKDPVPRQSLRGKTHFQVFLRSSPDRLTERNVDHSLIGRKRGLVSERQLTAPQNLPCVRPQDLCLYSLLQKAQTIGILIAQKRRSPQGAFFARSLSRVRVLPAGQSGNSQFCSVKQFHRSGSFISGTLLRQKRFSYFP